MLSTGPVLASADRPPARAVVIAALGVTQILAWGSSYYLLAVLAAPVATDTGWPLTWVVGGLSLGLLIAGLASPYVGSRIEQHGGRSVLAGSASLLALGQVGLGVSENLVVYVASWLVMGAGMGAGLYDAAFGTLGRLYGRNARSAITTLTLFGGFASTVCWPLSAYLVDTVGWRGACFVYAAIQLGISLPLYLIVLPRRAPQDQSDIGQSEVAPNVKSSLGLYVLLALTLTLAAFLSSTLSVHLLTILQERGTSLAEAVALGTFVGPCQVGARAVEMMVARYHHPIWTKVASATSVTIGIGVLWLGGIAPIALVFYGAGIGLESIARGTVPLAIFGSRGYAQLMGRLAMPSLLVQAAAPSIGAGLIQLGGAALTLEVLTALAAANVVLVGALTMALRRAPY